MSNLFCKTCRFKCSNEQSFTSHLKSKRHIRLNTPTDENISLTIEEEEEEPINTVQPNTSNDSLMRTLLLQNQMMMKLLMEKQTPNSITNEKNIKKFDVNEYLNTKCKKAINFEDLFTTKYILDTELNEKYVLANGEELYLKNIDKEMLPHSYKLFIDFFCTPFNEISHYKKPIFCSDVRRGVFYVKTENKWVKMNKFELSNKIFGPLFSRIFSLFANVFRLKQEKFKKIYKRNYYDWEINNKNEIMISICSVEKEGFVHKIIPALSKLCDKKYYSYKSQTIDEAINEEEPQESEPEDYESDTDEY